MIITKTENEELFYLTCAQRIADVIRQKPTAKIGFSTGRTTHGVHRALAKLVQEQGIDASGITVFGVDEITNMPRSCKASCWYLLLHEVVEPLGVSMEHYLMPDGNTKDPQKEAERFTALVNADGGPDFIFLGLGENGHIAFNQPGTPWNQSAVVSWMDDGLNERLRRENKELDPEVQMGGISLGIRDIMHSPHLVVGANGANKTAIVERMINGPVTTELPASILQLHPDTELILDPEAAKKLE